MNRFLLTILSAVCAMTFSLFAQTDSPSAKVALAHNSNLTFHPSVDDAQSKAVAGDTIFLSSGAFPEFEIKKNGLTFVGNGRSTVINGSLIINASNITIEGMKISKDITGSNEDCWIKICEIDGQLFSRLDSYNNIIIERCYLKKVEIGSYTSSLQFFNCIIDDFHTWYNGTDLNLYNCTINRFSDNWGQAQSDKYTNACLTNCIIENAEFCGYDSIMINCLYYRRSLGTTINCYLINDRTEINNLINASPEELLAHGYLGDDGTIVGPYGGTLGYTENPSLPTITDREVSIDRVNRTLTVKIHLTSAQSDLDNN